MPNVIGRNSFGLPKLKAIPIASPSIKLCSKELKRLRKPVDYLTTVGFLIYFPLAFYNYFFSVML